MQAVLRFLAVALLCIALGTFVAPGRMLGATSGMRCCESMHDCGQKSPSKEHEPSSCCQMCSLGMAMLFVPPPAFVYAQTGEEKFLNITVQTDAVSHRPPVPPPRASLG